MSQGDFIFIREVPVTDAVLTSSTISATDNAAYNAGTTYALGALVTVNATGVHRNYQSKQNGNVGYDPTNPANSAWWDDMGSTNRWAMFDDSTGTQSSAANTFTVVLAPGVPPGSFSFLNTQAASIRVVGVDPVDGTILDTTLYTAQDTLVADWYSYFFDDVVPRTDLFLDNLPPYANATWTITFTNIGDTASCGVFRMGRAFAMGKVQRGMRFGIIDYSTKQADTFGGYTIIRRGFSRRADLAIVVPNASVDAVAALLEEARATPTVFIGLQSFQSTFIFGFVKDWELSIQGPSASELSLSIEGLT